MQPNRRTQSTLSLAAAMVGFGLAAIAEGGVFVQNSSNSVAGGAGLAVSSTDLVNQGQPTFLNYTSSMAPQFGAGTVNNGVATNLTTAAAFYSVAKSLLPTTLVFNLNVATNRSGYTITRIDSLAGWEGGGTQTYANQKYTVEYSVVGSDAWLPLASVDYSPFTSTTSSTAAYTQSTVADSSGILAIGVDAIRFVYDTPTVSGGANGGMVLQEIDVEGFPTDAGVLIENTSNSVAGGAGLVVSSNDLVNQGQPTFLNYTSSKTPQFGAGTVNNGVATNLVTAAAFYRTGAGLLPTTLVFNLDVSVNAAGYDLSRIDSFAGWEGGGTQTYGNQSFTVEYSVVGDPEFVRLAAVESFPFTSTSSGTPAYSRSRITDVTGVLATGVDAVRFVYRVPTISGGTNGGLVIQEIDIDGTPSGPDLTAPTLAGSDMVDNRGGTPVDANKLVTYTVTFSEDMDAATVSAADFGNAGTAAVNFGLVAESSPGVFSVAVTPTSAGTLQLQVAAGASLKDVAGNSLLTASAIVDDTTITVNAAVPDTTAPSPNPMTFATAPYGSSATTIAMEATTATDPAGVEYYFTETSGNPGGSNSGWQSSASYQDTGLTTGMQYRYTVTARDLSANRNTTAPSGAAAATAETPPDPPSLITLTSPASRHIVQRSADNTGGIGIAGSYTSVPGAIQARAVVMAGAGNSGTSTAWQTITSAPSGGSFTGTLTGVPAGGWYQLEVRGLVGGVPGPATIRDKIGVGDIYITCGQSNSANHGAGGYSASDDRVCARTAVTGASWIAAADPVPIASGTGGSVWPRLGDLLAAAENIPIGFVAVGVGSTEVSQWLPGTTNYDSRLKPALQSFPARGFRAVLWHQGESDALASVSTATHASRLNSMIAQSRTDAGWTIPWYLAEASFHPSSNLSQEEPVTAGQRQVVHGDPQVFLGPGTDPFHLEDASGGKLNDSVHFNAAGLFDHARQWRDILRGTTTVTPRNGNFEDNRTPSITGLGALTDNASHIVNTTSDNDSPAVLGWRILSAGGTSAADGNNGFHNPGELTYAGAVDTTNNGVLPNMDGRHVAMLDGGSGGNFFLHSTRALAAPKTTYTLTVALGVRDVATGFGNARLEITANGVVVAGRTFTKADLDALRNGDSTGSFTDASVSWTTGITVAANQPIAVRISKPGGAGTVLDFDKVRLVSAVTPFASWQIDHWGDTNVTAAAWDANPDGDLLDNIFEFHLGLDPLANDTPVFFSKQNHDGKDWLRFAVPLDPAVDSAGLELWYSFNLDTWQPAATNPGGTVVNFRTADAWAIEVSTADHPRAYFRLARDRTD